VKNNPHRVRYLAAAISLAMFQLASAQQATDAKSDEPLNLDAVVVTGTSQAGSKMKSSVSVSTLSADQITKGGATNAAEVLRAIPGIRSESSGGESNANVNVRGVPLSAGGSRYVQFQEDGLPILQFGDIAFSTPDTFLRVDNSLDRLEVVRGGSASTLATGAPGGLINFISRTGEDKGGSIGISTGVDFNQKRFDFDLGGKVAEKTRFFIGGFYRTGEGVRTSNVNSEQGGQIKANITQEFDSGYVRLNFKHLDDQTPTNLPVPVTTDASGNISAIPGINPRTASLYSPYWVRDLSLNSSNGQVSSNVNSGITAKANSFGVEAAFKLADGWNISEKFRLSSQSGRFIGVFPADNNGSTYKNPVNGASAPVVPYTYATGPNAGQAFTGLPITVAVFNTSLDNMGIAVNDAKLSKTFQLGSDSSLTATGGLFTSLQHVALTWHFNHYLLTGVGENAALLQTSNAVVPGLLGAGPPAWGFCCGRNIDAEYRTTAPYINLAFETGSINIDASIRRDEQKATGTYNQAVYSAGTNAPLNLVYNQAGTKYINYKVNNTSGSLGGNYRIDKDLAVFARYSEGSAFNADRIMFGANKLDGSASIPINTVKQLEGGVKWRTGDLSTFVTVFDGKTDESNFEATTQKFTNNKYKARGVEVEAGYRLGSFKIGGGFTYTDAKIVSSLIPSFLKDAAGNDVVDANGNKTFLGLVEDTAVVGKQPRRQAKFVYQLSPSYSFGDATLGASIVGTTKSFGDDQNKLNLGGYTTVNAFARYQFTSNLEANVSVNNLFNTIGWTEVEGDGHAARSIDGRSVKAGVKYSF
jgi:outer membrane receptor protein involved in Fe transport